MHSVGLIAQLLLLQYVSCYPSGEYILAFVPAEDYAYVSTMCDPLQTVPLTYALDLANAYIETVTYVPQEPCVPIAPSCVPEVQEVITYNTPSLTETITYVPPTPCPTPIAPCSAPYGQEVVTYSSPVLTETITYVPPVPFPTPITPCASYGPVPEVITHSAPVTESITYVPSTSYATPTATYSYGGPAVTYSAPVLSETVTYSSPLTYGPVSVQPSLSVVSASPCVNPAYTTTYYPSCQQPQISPYPELAEVPVNLATPLTGTECYDYSNVLPIEYDVVTVPDVVISPPLDANLPVYGSMAFYGYMPASGAVQIYANCY